MEHLGKKISYFRRIKNISQNQMARILDVSQRTIARWESEKQDVKKSKRELVIFFTEKVIDFFPSDLPFVVYIDGYTHSNNLKKIDMEYLTDNSEAKVELTFFSPVGMANVLVLDNNKAKVSNNFDQNWVDSIEVVCDKNNNAHFYLRNL